MGEVDRIPPVAPAILLSQPSPHVEMRKEGRQQRQDQTPHDVLEFHETEEEPTETPVLEIVESEPHHGLDLTA